MEIQEIYMHRALQLAALGQGKVAPNPMVGAVLVHNDRIIGEGYHMQYGGPHAEPNCIAGVADADRGLISESDMYVTLEPCAHFGKTPPCAELLIREKVKRVIIGCRDPFELVNGRGIEKLKAAGIEVITGMLENQCRIINQAFFMFHILQRPYIILKWAQTADGFIGAWNHGPASRAQISGETANRLVHKWRSETASILVGTNTALKDDPSLTTRFWQGTNPLRLVIDRNLRIPVGSKILNKEAPTIVFNYHRSFEQENIIYQKFDGRGNVVRQLLDTLYENQINSLLVEGGSQMLQSFIDLNLWDEARVITNSRAFLRDGVRAPILKKSRLVRQEYYGDDSVSYLDASDTAKDPIQ